MFYATFKINMPTLLFRIFFDFLSARELSMSYTLNCTPARTFFCIKFNIFSQWQWRHTWREPWWNTKGKKGNVLVVIQKKDLKEKPFQRQEEKDGSFVCLSVAGDSSGLKWAWRMYKIWILHFANIWTQLILTKKKYIWSSELFWSCSNIFHRLLINCEVSKILT